MLKLMPTPQQSAALLDTMRAFNRGCQHVADVAYAKRCSSGVALQKDTYGELRGSYGLSSQMACLAVRKAADAYKRDKRIHICIGELSAITYDRRILSFKGITLVSLLTLSGRITVPFVVGQYQSERLHRAMGQADLVYHDGLFLLHVTIDLPTPPVIEPQDVLGVDLGIAVLAVDSDGEAHTGEGIKQCRRKHSRLRAGLQKAGTKSAKRHLKRFRRRESRYQRNINHVIIKHLVKKALVGQKALAIEELSGIRDRMQATVPKTLRYERLSWAFAQLRQFLAYKCEAAGIPLIVIDPRNTSRTCPACGHCAKENRRTQSEFLCKECGFQANADWVGSVNMRKRGLEARANVMSPMVSANAIA